MDHLNKTRLVIAVLAITFAALPAGSFAAEESAADNPPISTNERIVTVPGHPPNPVKLVVTIMTPAGAGPFPLAVLNHGSDATIPAARQERYHRSFGAYYFLSRGYAVAIPMMRGFAGSEGHQMDSHCDPEALGLANAFDIDAVIDYMVKQPYVDGRHIVVAGGSFGGWNTLAYGMLNRPEVKGLINFAGGALISNCHMQGLRLDLAVEHFGKGTQRPSLWIYGDNDSMFSADVWHSMYDRYVAAGGKAELVPLGKFMRDTHNLLGYSEAMALWAPKVDAFLGRIGLPHQVPYPDFVPTQFPPPSRFAALDDVAAVPYLNAEGREVYKKFLTLPMPRVFFLAPTGWARPTAGGFDPLALGRKLCAEAGQECQVYAVDDYVAWTARTSAAAPVAANKPAPVSLPAGKHDEKRDEKRDENAGLANLDAVPYLTESGRQAYRQFLILLHGSRAFAVAPDGGYGFAAGANSSADAMAICSKLHQGCRLYVVDNAIVWSESK
jgi:dienelactone hydrolase